MQASLSLQGPVTGAPAVQEPVLVLHVPAAWQTSAAGQDPAEGTQAPAEHVAHPEHEVPFCHVPLEEQTCGTPDEEHCLAVGVQATQPVPARQLLLHVCGLGLAHTPPLQVPVAW